MNKAIEKNSFKIFRGPHEGMQVLQGSCGLSFDVQNNMALYS